MVMAAVILPRSSAIVLLLPLVTTAPKLLNTTPCRSIITSGLRRRRFERISAGRRSSQRWRVHASSVAEEALPDPESVIENAKQEVQSGNDDISSTIVSALLFIAFVGLTLLTIGVIYLGVTDFLQKRERDKFEKEEAAKKKKNGKKGKKVKARAGPRGFGQKLEEQEDQDI